MGSSSLFLPLFLPPSQAVYTCNCDSEKDKSTLSSKVEEVISELQEMEKERILDLGSPYKATYVEGDKSSTMTSDLMATKSLSSSAHVR